MASHLLTQTLPREKIANERRYMVKGTGGGLDPSQAVAIVRHDLYPPLEPLLGVRSGSIVKLPELAAILAGRRTDGSHLVGRQHQRASACLADELGLDPERPASVKEAQAILAGARADDGRPFIEARSEILIDRFLKLYGVTPETTAAISIEDLVASSSDAAGKRLSLYSYRRQLTVCRTPLAHLHICLSAEKDVSLAWGFARTDDERGLVAACHERACAKTMLYIEGILGRARRGKAGINGDEAGYLAYIGVTHYTGRPTYGPARNMRVAGDPQVHTHVIVPNAILTEGGHVGSINLHLLKGRVHQVGALYMAFVADELRGLGVDVAFNRDTNRLRICLIPPNARTAFSKRTAVGTRMAREFAGLDEDEWDALWTKERIARAKGGIQGDFRSFKKDDVADFSSWNAEAERIGWTPGPILDLCRQTRIGDRDRRMALAEEIAAQQLDTALQAGATVDASSIRLAATRGLIAAGIDTTTDIGSVASMLERRFAGHASAKSFTLEKGKRRTEAAEHSAYGLERTTAALHAMRSAGTATLVEGGEPEVLEHIADLWMSCAEKSKEAGFPTVGLGTDRSSRIVTDMIRRRRRVAGDLGGDRMEFASLDDHARPRPIDVTVGDPVLLTDRSPEDFRDRRRGVASVKANLHTVVAIEKRWLVVETPGGRRGRVLWHDLHARGDAHLYRLTHGYVVPSAAIGKHTGDRIEAFPGGVGAGGQIPQSVLKDGPERRYLVIDAKAERLDIARSRKTADPASISVEDIWAHVAKTLSTRRSVAAGMALLRRASAAAIAATQTIRIATAVFETRTSKGLASIAVSTRYAFLGPMPDATAYTKKAMGGAIRNVRAVSAVSNSAERDAKAQALGTLPSIAPRNSKKRKQQPARKSQTKKSGRER